MRHQSVQISDQFLIKLRRPMAVPSSFAEPRIREKTK